MVTKVKTVGELKAYLDTIDPNALLQICATGRDPEMDPEEDVELSISTVCEADQGIELNCWVNYCGVLEICNANVDDMIYNPY